MTKYLPGLAVISAAILWSLDGYIRQNLSTLPSFFIISLEHIIGAISEGYQADLIFWKLNKIAEIPYWMGSDRILNVMKKGKLIEKERELGL